MRRDEEEQSCETDQIVDFISAVKELHQFTLQELNKLLKDSENFIIKLITEKGSSLQIDIDKLARFLPLHLIAVLISSDRDTDLFKYLLCGLRLLHSLCSLAPKQQKLEQILLDDVKVSEQLLDFVFYLLIFLGGYRQNDHLFGPISLLHSALVSCGLHLLTECISAQWQDIVLVLLAHPKVDTFMDVAFGAICVNVRFLQTNLSSQHTEISTEPFNVSEKITNYLCQQCEASLSFIHSLCQQKSFRERLLRNKELCGKGGVLLLVLSVLKLEVKQSFRESFTVVAAVSRLKSKVLSILLKLCEVDCISYLDEVANSSQSLDFAKSVAFEVLEILKTAFERKSKPIGSSLDKASPVGLLQLNAMRLADIFSDDSNFQFTSCWCSSSLPLREEDGILEFDPFNAAGWALDLFLPSEVLNTKNFVSNFTPKNMHQASYAHQRTSLLVKVISNLYCFVPDICEEQERNLFLHKFLECLQIDLPYSSISNAPKATAICTNLRSLLGHAESLVPNFLNEEDVHLLREFFKQVQSVLSPAECEVIRSQSRFREAARKPKFDWNALLMNFSSDDGSDSHERAPRNCPQKSKATDKESVPSKGVGTTSKFSAKRSKPSKSVSEEAEVPYKPVLSKLNVFDEYEVAPATSGCLLPIVKKPVSGFNNRSTNLKEEMSDNSAFQRNDGFYDLSKHWNKSAGTDGKKDKAKSSRADAATFKVFSEVDRDLQNAETSGSDSSSTRGKSYVHQIDKVGFPKSSEYKETGFNDIQDDEKNGTALCEEKQRRKRKRPIMNDEQMSLIERALVDEPDMQRNAHSVQAWADKLSIHGSEVTSSQLRNWLNNRKARLARIRLAKDAPVLAPVRQQQDGDNANPNPNPNPNASDMENRLAEVFGTSSPESPIVETEASEAVKTAPADLGQQEVDGIDKENGGNRGVVSQ